MKRKQINEHEYGFWQFLLPRPMATELTFLDCLLLLVRWLPERFVEKPERINRPHKRQQPKSN